MPIFGVIFRPKIASFTGILNQKCIFDKNSELLWAEILAKNIQIVKSKVETKIKRHLGHYQNGKHSNMQNFKESSAPDLDITKFRVNLSIFPVAKSLFKMDHGWSTHVQLMITRHQGRISRCLTGHQRLLRKKFRR